MKSALTVVMVFFFFYGPNTTAIGQLSREYQIKAAFLYNFGKFVDWPDKAFEDESTPIIYCIIGRDPFGDILDHALEGKSIRGRPVFIERLVKPEKLEHCHLLFVSSSEQKRLIHIFKAIGTSNVLTVGDDMEGFANLGGIINLIKRGNKIRFEINPIVARQADLRLDFRLLNLAIIVEP